MLTVRLPFPEQAKVMNSPVLPACSEPRYARRPTTWVLLIVGLSCAMLLAAADECDAQAAQSCDGEPSVAQTRQCLDRQFKATMDDLHAKYATLMASPKVSAEQKGRVKRRQAAFDSTARKECLASARKQVDGTSTPEIALDCMITRSRNRVHQLEAMIK